MSAIGTRLFTWLRGEAVGEDEFGNRYFQERRAGDGKPRRRWVLYRGVAEASKVPQGWNAWLHRTVDEPPGPVKARPWEKGHLPNLTGTGGRWLPKGHLLRGGERAAATGDYEAWTPGDGNRAP